MFLHRQYSFIGTRFSSPQSISYWPTVQLKNSSIWPRAPLKPGYKNMSFQRRHSSVQRSMHFYSIQRGLWNNVCQADCDTRTTLSWTFYLRVNEKLNELGMERERESLAGLPGTRPWSAEFQPPDKQSFNKDKANALVIVQALIVKSLRRPHWST